MKKKKKTGPDATVISAAGRSINRKIASQPGPKSKTLFPKQPEQKGLEVWLKL
jgi:hypothetical protein